MKASVAEFTPGHLDMDNLDYLLFQVVAKKLVNREVCLWCSYLKLDEHNISHLQVRNFCSIAPDDDWLVNRAAAAASGVANLHNGL